MAVPLHKENQIEELLELALIRTGLDKGDKEKVSNVSLRFYNEAINRGYGKERAEAEMMFRAYKSACEILKFNAGPTPNECDDDSFVTASSSESMTCEEKLLMLSDMTINDEDNHDGCIVTSDNGVKGNDVELTSPKCTKLNKKVIGLPKKAVSTIKKPIQKKHEISFVRSIHKVLKQVHPDMKISSKSMTIMDSFVSDMIERIAEGASELVEYNDRATLTSNDIQTAVQLLIPSQLANNAIIKGTEALGKLSIDAQPDSIISL